MLVIAKNKLYTIEALTFKDLINSYIFNEYALKKYNE